MGERRPQLRSGDRRAGRLSSETFDADWLALREPIDHRSRSEDQARALARWLGGPGAPIVDSDAHEVEPGATIVDLGSGTGSNLRYLAPRLSSRQHWTLIDHDRALLDRVTEGASVGNIRSLVADLSDLESKETTGVFASADVVTASALLDLVSREWLEEVAERCSQARCAVLFALSYDGSIVWSGTPHADDEFVRAAMNTHQMGDKGLGAALGPDAGTAAAACFEQHGYEVTLTPTPWRLDRHDVGLAHALVDGWERAAIEVHPDREARLRSWGAARRDALARGESTLTVGHLDVLALPAAPGGQPGP